LSDEYEKKVQELRKREQIQKASFKKTQEMRIILDDNMINRAKIKTALETITKTYD
jgi:hypothetical protein